MIVMVTMVKGEDSNRNFFGFCSDCNNSNEKVNKRNTRCEKLVGNGSVMDNYVGCGLSCNSHNLG